MNTSEYEGDTELCSIYRSGRPKVILTSVSRVSEQKTSLLRAPGTSVTSGLEGILEKMKEENGLYILLGTGNAEYERFLTEVSSRYTNFVFLNGFSEHCANTLYANGDLFLMPSAFEPCGISHMLAMRDGQPCLVHGVGGLRDTVEHNENGFLFEGSSLEEQVDNFVKSCLEAIRLKREDPTTWQTICNKALEARFFWKDTVAQYIKQLYLKKGITAN